jgi:hypothetical protein
LCAWSKGEIILWLFVAVTLPTAIPKVLQEFPFHYNHQIRRLLTMFLFDDARLPLPVFATIASISVHLLDALPDHQAHPKASSTSDLHTAEVCLH